MQQQLDSLPPGKLIVTKNQTRLKWYVSENQHLTYIPKSQRPYAEALAKRKYLSLKLQDLIHEKNAIQYYLHPKHGTATSANQLLSDPHYQDLLSSCFQLGDQAFTDWTTFPYERNTNYPEQLIHNSVSGNVVRSKSEALIDMALYVKQIPFRYESLLTLNGIPIYPDFTILHPRTRQIYYWEHFGMMDNDKYAQNTCSKLAIYASNNIIPSIQLITTFETKEHPLSSELVDELIQHYFL